MGMTPNAYASLRSKLATELQKRTGGYGRLTTLYGAVSQYASEVSAAPNVVFGQPITSEQGAVLINNYLKIQDFGDLRNVHQYDPIPGSFSNDASKSDSMAKGLALLAAANDVVNSNSCRGACTGYCTGTCFSGCNGCTSCSGVRS